MIGALFYHAVDITQDPSVLWGIIEKAESATRGHSLRWFSAIYPGTEARTRWRILKPSDRSQLEVDLKGGVFDLLMFDETRQRDVGNDESFGLDVRVGRFDSSNPDWAFPFTLRLVYPESALISERSLVEACKAIFATLESPYAFIYPGDSHADVYMELTSIPFRVQGTAYSPAEEDRFKWLQFWQRHERELGSHIRTAYCGNLLGRELVARLGGDTRVIAEAPASVVESIPGGGIYLQVSRALDCTNEPDRLTKLASYLIAISVASRYSSEIPVPQGTE
jgi:hypothetical protein